MIGGQKQVAPPEYHGKSDKNATFEQWSDLFRNWAAAMHKEGTRMLDLVEDSSFDLDDFDMNMDEVASEFNGRVYEQLFKCARGETISFVKNPDRNGFKAWRKLVHHFDPREGVDATVAYEKVANPSPVKSTTEARIKLPLWEAEVREYESKH